MLTQELHTFARLELVALDRLLKAFPEYRCHHLLGNLCWLCSIHCESLPFFFFTSASPPPVTSTRTNSPFAVQKRHDAISGKWGKDHTVQSIGAHCPALHSCEQNSGDLSSSIRQRCCCQGTHWRGASNRDVYGLRC